MRQKKTSVELSIRPKMVDKKRAMDSDPEKKSSAKKAKKEKKEKKEKKKERDDGDDGKKNE